jgi:uncharacterized peroxidase-related enzyme
VLADYKTAPISDKLRGLLGFLEKLTLHPETVTPADVEPLRALGLSDAAIEDAIHVTAMFNIFDRLADAMGWEVPAEAEFWPAQTKYLLKYGYEGGKKPAQPT